MSQVDFPPLAAASVRLRKPPGRPRRTGSEHSSGTPSSGGLTESGKEFRQPAYEAVASIPPRLLDLPATAAYLGLSEWTVRDLEANGTLRRVSIPLPRGRELRKLLFDRTDLDRLVEAWKQG